MILQDFVALRIPSQFVMAVTPFKAKAEERAKLCKKDEESPDRPAKRMCNAYEKQIAKMPTGDLTTAKEHPAFPLSMYIYIYMYMYTHIYIYKKWCLFEEIRMLIFEQPVSNNRSHPHDDILCPHHLFGDTCWKDAIWINVKDGNPIAKLSHGQSFYKLGC